MFRLSKTLQLLLQLQQLLCCRVQVPGLLHRVLLTDQTIENKEIRNEEINIINKIMTMEDYDDG